MLRLTLSEEDIKELDYQRYHHPHPRVWMTDFMTRFSTPHRGKARKQLWGSTSGSREREEEQNQTILTRKGGTLMLLEADVIVKRATLRWLAQRHPSWTQQELATALHLSRSWVSKWLQRQRQADPVMSWPCMPVRGHAARHLLPSPPNRRSSSGSWRSASPPQSTCTACLDQKPSSSKSVPHSWQSRLKAA